MIGWNILIDVGTKAVLTISAHTSVVVFLRECTLDTGYATNVNFPHYTRSLIHPEAFFLARGNPDNYPQWTWVRKTRMFTKTREDVITPQLIERSRLATAKARVISDMMASVSNMRTPLRSGIDFQDIVYAQKRNQAQRFKDGGYNEDIALETPYVLQYADLKNIPLKQAADEILFQALLSEERLVKTELVRLKYFDMVRQAKKPEDLPDISFRFRNEAFHIVDA